MKNNKKLAIAYLHTHWDPEWYRTIDAFNVRLVEVLDNVLIELKNGSAPCFYFDGQVYSLLNYLKFRPEKKSLIKKLIKEKKFFIGPFFASIDSFLSSGMALIKNLEYGMEISKEFGQKDFIGYLSDTFGHSKSIFKILKQFDINNAIMWRGIGVKNADFIVNHIKSTRLVYGYYQDILHSDLSIEKKAEIIEKVLDKINEISNDVLLLPLGADHMGILKDSKKQIKEINKHLKNYEIKLSSPFEYIKKADYKTEIRDCEFLDNSETFVLKGVYSARINEKIENAKLQFDLFNNMQLFNYFMGGKYNSELKVFSKELIKNHAHDSMYGCSIDEVHKNVRQRQTSVKEGIKAVKNNLIRDFKNKNLVNENQNMVGVFNFSNYVQNQPVKIISDKKIKNAQKISEFVGVSDDILYDIYKNPMSEDFHKFYEYLIEIDEIRPYSFKNFEIKKPIKKQIVGVDFIENENLKLFVFENKIYVIDKKTNKTYSDFIQIHSTKDGGDSYNYAPIEENKILKLKNSKVKLNGKIKSTLQIVFEENIKLDVSLTNNSKMFEFEINLNNKKKNRLLQVVVNSDSLIKKTVSEDAIGIIERTHDPNYSLYKNIPVKGRYELKTNSYPAQRFVKANGIGVITLGLNEYEIYKNSLKISILRSVGIISNPKNPARGVPAGPPIECPEMQLIGQHSANFAITFEDDLFKLSDSFYNPFISILGEFKTKNKTYLKVQDGLFYGIIKKDNKNYPLFFT